MIRVCSFGRALAGVLPALALVACAPDTEGQHLSASRWSFALIDGQSPMSDAADMRFEKGEVRVLVGCNRMSGPWRISADRLVAGPLVQTEMACPAPAWDQEKAVGSLLASTPRIRVNEERMILQSSGHTAELIRVED